MNTIKENSEIAVIILAEAPSGEKKALQIKLKTIKPGKVRFTLETKVNLLNAMKQ